jgi:hypothetical protein
LPAGQLFWLLSAGFVGLKIEKGALIASVLVPDSSALPKEWVLDLEPNGSPAWLVALDIAAKRAMGALLGFEL